MRATESRAVGGIADSNAPGLIYQAHGLRVLDVNRIPWEATPIAPASKLRPLSFDDDGDTIAVYRVMTRPVAPVPLPPPVAQIEFHAIRELYMCLEGEMTHREYAHPGAEPHTIMVRAGYWMDRKPGSIHGPGDPRARVGVGGIAFMCPDDDPLVGVREAPSLTHEVAFASPRIEQALPPVDVEEPRPVPELAIEDDNRFATFLRTQELDWLAHPVLPGSSYKPLSWRRDGDATVALVSLPAGPYPVPLLPYRTRQAFRELIYVREGDLTLRHYADPDDEEGTPFTVYAGCWIDRGPDAIVGFAPEDCSEAGAMFLQARFREGTLITKNREKQSRWTYQLNPEVSTAAPNATAADWEAVVAAGPSSGLNAREAFEVLSGGSR
jgi:hypothetical protein